MPHIKSDDGVLCRNQRNKLKLDNLSLPSPERHRPLRHQFSSDNMHVQPFNIPNLRIEQRKTSSAEDMARKNSTGKYFVAVAVAVTVTRTDLATNLMFC
jgi:SCY1-like protein 2